MRESMPFVFAVLVTVIVFFGESVVGQDLSPAEELKPHAAVWSI